METPRIQNSDAGSNPVDERQEKISRITKLKEKYCDAWNNLPKERPKL
jgi:hypothetical protein